MREIDPLVWFSKREIKPTPKHFIRAQTPVTNESKLWVMTKLKGRYSFNYHFNDKFDLLTVGTSFTNDYIFFEDPKDVMIYELRWAGSK